MHLFVSFILKAIAVFIKDVVLYEVGEVDNCSSGSVSCFVIGTAVCRGCFQMKRSGVFFFSVRLWTLKKSTLEEAQQVQRTLGVCRRGAELEGWLSMLRHLMRGLLGSDGDEKMDFCSAEVWQETRREPQWLCRKVTFIITRTKSRFFWHKWPSDIKSDELTYWLMVILLNCSVALLDILWIYISNTGLLRVSSETGLTTA